LKKIGWLFSCPGGATADAFGKFYGDENIKKNVLAPILVDSENVLHTPCNKDAVVQKLSTTAAECFAEYGICQLTRQIALQDEVVEFRDRICFLADCRLTELRLFNFPVVTDKFDYQLDEKRLILKHDAHTVNIVCYPSAGDAKMTVFETIRTAKGHAQCVGIGFTDLDVKKDQSFQIDFEIRSAGVQPGDAG
jgi:hypothetical protein